MPFSAEMRSKHKNVIREIINQEIKSKLLPRKISIIKIKGQNNVMNLNNCRIGDKYAETIQMAIKQLETVKSLNLCKNRLTDITAKCVCKNFDALPDNLNLSFNRIKNLKNLCMAIKSG